MVQRVHTVAFQGVEVLDIDVEVQVSPGLPQFNIMRAINLREKKRAPFDISKILIIFFSITLATFPNKAFADWESNFLQVTCMPDIDYFSVKSFALESVDALSEEKAAATGIYSLRQAVNKPISCQLKNKEISIKKISYEEPRSGYCGVETAVFAITADGDILAKINSGNDATRVGCAGQKYESEVVLSRSFQKNCTTVFDLKKPTNIVSSYCEPVETLLWSAETGRK